MKKGRRCRGRISAAIPQGRPGQSQDGTSSFPPLLLHVLDVPLHAFCNFKIFSR